MYYHLIHIDRFYDTTSIPSGRFIWHFFWAKIFHFFNIPNSEVFFRAKIIHIVQTYIAFFSVYIFSKVVIRNTFKEIDKTLLKYLSLWSIVIWFTIFATFSMYYHLVWNLWYSVNYQVTLPLFLYITALTIIVFLEKRSWVLKLFYIFQIIIISRFILQAHSMEYLYYLMYVFVFTIIYFDKTLSFIKKYFYIVIPVIISIIFFAKKYQPERSRFFDYLSIEKLPALHNEILKQGKLLIEGFNRAFASINELIIFITIISLLSFFVILYRKIKNKENPVNIRFFIFLLITTLFVYIPVIQYTAGLFAIITKAVVVNRIYYSSSIFVMLPIVVYYFYQIFTKDAKKYILRINLSIATILVLVLFYSYHFSSSKNYYKNVKSILYSFTDRYNFHLTSEQIKKIGKEIEKYEKNNQTGKPIYFFARADIAFVIKFIYRKNVFWQGRWANPDYKKAYKEHLNNKDFIKKYYPVLFKTPRGFPNYEPFR